MMGNLITNKEKVINFEEAKKIHDSLIDIKEGSEKQELLNRAYGCVVGAFVGDALGSYHEFSREVSEPLLNKVMEQPGGGTFKIIAGQVTDDSEMALSLADGLIEHKYEKDINPDQIARHYGIWIKSEPFDLGRTTANALFSLKKYADLSKYSIEQLKSNNIGNQCIENSSAQNQKSQSNGCLMRASPLAIYALRFDGDSLSKIGEEIRKDVQLTHSNEVAQLATITYVLALREAVITGKADGIIEKIQEYVAKEVKNQNLKEEFQVNFLDKISETEFMPAVKNMGYCGIAWQYSFNFLKSYNTLLKSTPKEDIYKNYMRKILSFGGDTDTNGAIAGAMMGAILGYNKIPQAYLNNLLSCNLENSQIKRPQKFYPHRALLVTEQLLKYARL